MSKLTKYNCSVKFKDNSIWKCACMYVCVYIQTHAQMCVSVKMYISTSVCLYAYLYKCLYVHMHVCMLHVHMYLNMYGYRCPVATDLASFLSIAT